MASRKQLRSEMEAPCVNIRIYAVCVCGCKFAEALLFHKALAPICALKKPDMSQYARKTSHSAISLSALVEALWNFPTRIMSCIIRVIGMEKLRESALNDPELSFSSQFSGFGTFEAAVHHIQIEAQKQGLGLSRGLNHVITVRSICIQEWYVITSF